MKTTILSFALAAVMLGALPATAGEFGAGSHLAGLGLAPAAAPTADVFERRGRGHGRDDDRSSDDRGGRRGGHGGGRSSDDGVHYGRNDDHRSGRSSDDRRSGGHGGRPRVPGGSGCDDAHDLVEHPDCRA